MKYVFTVLALVLFAVSPSFPAPTEGGLTNPLDSKTEVGTPLPSNFKFKNVGGTDGAGLCVFASITYCARYQNERKLIDLFDKMKREKGGGWPEKVDAMIKKYGPGTQYIQDTSGNYDLLVLAIKTGRPVGVTYDGHDSHYGPNATIAHMVQLVYADDKFACISDNNFPGDNQYMWMSKSDFITRWKGNHGGWCVILLNPGPPPVPHN
jgi:hypothetical protein